MPLPTPKTAGYRNHILDGNTAFELGANTLIP